MERDESTGKETDAKSHKDWRLQAVSELAELCTPRGQLDVTYPKGAIVRQAGQFPVFDGRVLTLHIPNATALFLNISHRHYNDARTVLEVSGIRKGAREAVMFTTDAEAFHYLECFMTSVIAAYTAVEAFANEAIPDDYVYRRQHKGREEILAKAEIELRLALSKKMNEVLPAALKAQAPKGKCWDGFHRLETMRERIIHMKSADRNMIGPARGTVWEHLFKFPEPVTLALPILDHFARQMEAKRGWATERPF